MERITNISPNPEIIIATAKRKTQKIWNNKKLTWEDFLKRLANPVTTPETMEEWQTMDKQQQDKIKDVGGFVGGELKDGIRRKGSVQNRTIITLDVDYPSENINLFEDALNKWDFAFAGYSTHKYTPENPRIRLVIPLERPVSPEQYLTVSKSVAETLGLDYFDKTTYQPERLMFWPSHSKDAPYYFNYHQGSLLDPDQIPTVNNGQKNGSNFPELPNTIKKYKREAKLAGDPLKKPGEIGAFNRVYSIQEAIKKFLPDVYAPTDQEDHYTYINGSTTGGLVLYNGVFAYSHHNSDPTCNKLTNAFDLVRVHKFGNLDTDTRDNTPITEFPSYKKMCEFVLNDQLVYKEWKSSITNNDFAPLSSTDQVNEFRWLSRNTNTGNPTVNTYLLAQQLVIDYHLHYSTGTFLRYDPTTGIWQKDAEGFLSSLLTTKYLKNLSKTNINRETIRVVKDILRQGSPDEFNDSDPMRIVLQNGVYNLKTNEFSPKFDPDLQVSVNYPVEYNPSSKAPYFEGFVTEILGEEYLPLIYEWIGYLFYRGYPVQKILFVYGVGGAGKTTLINVIRNVIGEKASSSVSLEALVLNRFATAGLYQKTANFDSDARAQFLEDGSVLKKLTGEDSVFADVKFGDQFQFRNYAKLTLSMNQLPSMRDYSGGLERRAMILRINKKVAPETKEKYPYSEMLKESSGIFNKAMEGLRRLLDNGYFSETESMRTEVKKWVNGNDQVGRFVSDAIVKDENHFISVKDMYKAYKDYSEENGERAIGKYKFGQRLEDMGLVKVKTQENGIRYWKWQDVNFINQ
ncbi:hypothetical protein XA3_19930 [Xylocopilactobacillus apicola]|uniref:SF3 helicase domain-containing protein n=1 Tax=Xylocopilactobacillus apicola TaxID=2932184 RepID=A0AAU9DF56_9LACO|nr:hypothetical protein XA3_19930 [Xylocopilactobacillus apicola]